ncbi:MAG: 1-(5-phosphoribosyl)-5-[(5-phosphoribosylamino)methylideneamino]imidazole-4-carboxamide isomerase [Oscillospiraceae bacterium]|nr:1-(5-phosphoribosyl)-5-[(5-phosphoribosylamino)methylideneamino]imidazole-4-carboxamide isomerase [Oscillospiraceae bacterium]
MLIIPAIDLIDGKAVRLYQGDYKKSRIFGDDPAAFAKRFYDGGAKWLHLVDLDGARSANQKNLKSVQRIITAVPTTDVELGGGIRDEDAVTRCFALGVSRVILGTAALKDREFTARMVKAHGEKLAVGVDARDGRVATEGWTEGSDADSIEFCKQMRDLGVRHIIYTDISKDGAGKGTNLPVYRRLTQEIKGVCITASGGISSLDEIKALRDMGVYASILGSALYTGAVELEKAIEVAE